MLKLFLKLEFGKGSKYFRTNKAAKSITGLLFFFVFFLVFSGIYLFFVYGFKYINANIEESLRLPITLFIYEIFLLVLVGIIVLSCTISSIFSLFRGANDNWIISSPAFRIFPKLVFVKSLLRSMWPFFVVFLPVVLALYKVYNLGALSLLFIFLSFIVLLVLADALTLSLIIAVSLIYYRVSRVFSRIRFSFGGLIAVILMLVVAAASLAWRISGNIDLVKLFRADATGAAADIAEISGHFYFLPTHPFAMEIVNWQSGRTAGALLDFYAILLFSAICVLIMWILSGRFYPLWQKLQEGSSGEDARRKAFFGSGITFRFRGGKLAALFKKESLVLMRNPRGMLWFLFLLAIWLAQAGANRVLGGNIHGHNLDLAQRLAMIQSLQFIVAVYFICAFTLRFVFPAFSVEKKTAWILASAPLSFRKMYFGKYLFYSIFFVVVGTAMSYINASILNLPFSHAAYSMLLFVAVVIFIVTLGLSFGAVFPNSETDDPEIISTSMPGLFFTALALIYGAFGDLALYFTLSSGNASSLLLFIATTIVLVAIMLKKTPDFAGKRIFS